MASAGDCAGARACNTLIFDTASLDRLVIAYKRRISFVCIFERLSSTLDASRRLTRPSRVALIACEGRLAVVGPKLVRPTEGVDKNRSELQMMKQIDWSVLSSVRWAVTEFVGS